MAETPKTNYLLDAWLIITLALVFGGALAGVHLGLNPRIQQNMRDKTFDQIPVLVPGAQADKSREVLLADGTRAYQAKTADGEPVGWVIAVSGQGFADVIELLIGADPDVTRITGMFVLRNSETPGLGNKIVREQWRAQFAGQAAAPLTVVKRPAAKDSREIQAVTGATVSSESVVAIVNRALETYGPELRALAGEGR